ncbi:MAG: histidinol-phosphate aminotransferase family protein [Myxococcales bacterium]|nr:MAG: histidinol-phosphate aminotransferase family protein [Myxococcales bacterium]
MANSPAKKLGKSLKVVSRYFAEPSRSVRDLAPYDPVSSLPRILERPEMEHFKLDWNECTIPPSPKVRRAVMQYIDGQLGLNYYPELFSNELRHALQRHVGLPYDHILVTNGSDDALELVCKTYLDPGDVVLAPYPTYTHAILFAKSRGATIEKVLYDDPFTADLDRLLAQIRPETKLIYLVNPNNPTGAMFEPEELAQIAEAAPQAIVLIDEAYVEFSGRENALSLVHRYDNVVVTRTFSKLYGMAALRIGYLVSSQPAIRELSKLYNPKSVNQLAQVAAIAAVEDADYYARYVEEVTHSKRLFGMWCERHGLDFHSTPANFAMVKVDRLEEVIDALAEEGVYVRDRSGLDQCAGYFRLNLGTVEQTTTVIRRFERVLKRLGLID